MALSMVSAGHLEPVNLAFQTPSQVLFWAKNSVSMCKCTHTHRHNLSISNPLRFTGCTKNGQWRIVSEPRRVGDLNLPSICLQ